MAETFNVKLKLLENYVFEIDFSDFGKIISDEPEPLGQSEGPSPVHLLAASVANCLCASLLFAIRKYKEDAGDLHAVISGEPTRQDGRLRIARMHVTIYLGNTETNLPSLQKALDKFEDFCLVTQSVRQGVDVSVSIFDSNNKQVM